MIKLVNPVGITNKDITNRSSEGFYNRINDNYKLMRSQINSEDLLHAFTQAPEVFLAEGDTTNIFNSTVNVSNTQKQKLEVLNNLINRILIMDGTQFTYQDNVYISSVLNKLGINDVQSFITQVRNLIDETKLTYTQNKTLNESLNEIRKISETVNKTNINLEAGDDAVDTVEADNSFYLHQNILERLSFSELANYVNQVTTRPFTEKIVTRNDIISAENLRISEHLKLQELQNEITHTSTPMIFNHENMYEENIDIDENIDESTVKTNLVKAMLVSYIDNLYQARAAKIINNNDTWFESVNELHLSVDNTVKRYTENLVNPISNILVNEFHEGEINNYTSLQNSLKHVITQLENIEEGDEINVSNENSSTINTQLNKSQIEQISNQINTNISNSSQSQAVMTNIEINNDNSRTSQEVLSEQLNNIEQNNIENRKQVINAVNAVAAITEQGKRNSEKNDTDFSSSRTEIINLEQNIEKNLSEDEIIIEELKKVEQHNLYNQNQYIRAMQALNELARGTKSEPKGSTRQREESLKALDNPEELIYMYREEKNSDAIEDANRQQEIIDSLPDDIKKYVDIVDKYLIHPTPETRRSMVADPLSVLAQDIAEVESRKEQLKHVVVKNTENVISEETANQIIENITNNSVVNSQIEERVTQNVEKLSFVHKENVYIDEEEIQERFKQLKQEKTENTVVTNQVNETTQVINKTEVTKEVIDNVIGSEKIVRMVAQNVSDQLNSLSDQVYAKLEKRLINEKRRRGL